MGQRLIQTLENKCALWHKFRAFVASAGRLKGPRNEMVPNFKFLTLQSRPWVEVTTQIKFLWIKDFEYLLSKLDQHSQGLLQDDCVVFLGDETLGDCGSLICGAPRISPANRKTNFHLIYNSHHMQIS